MKKTPEIKVKVLIFIFVKLKPIQTAASIVRNVKRDTIKKRGKIILGEIHSLV